MIIFLACYMWVGQVLLYRCCHSFLSVFYLLIEITILLKLLFLSLPIMGYCKCIAIACKLCCEVDMYSVIVHKEIFTTGLLIGYKKHNY